jgi:pyruvate formate-lyase activating enzyme-like uncharacterized protein
MPPSDARMRKVVRTPAGSFLLGEMPRGCKLCTKGAKLVLFVTGLCRRGCFYCPLSEKRKGKDVVYANERPVKSPKEIIEEARAMGALGTGITGGDPALRFDRTLRYIRLLKRTFGPKHHIHMYCLDLTRAQLSRLEASGLDELRFHTWDSSPLERAMDYEICSGVELPAIPGKFEEIKRVLIRLDEIGCKFVNLNELEFSETNWRALKAHGFVLKHEESIAVKGSQELALKVLSWAKRNTRLNVHYCPSSLKDGVQLRNRLLRRAKRTARPYEVITPEGTLWLGIAYGKKELEKERRKLIREFGIPPSMVFFNRQRKRLEMPPELAEELAGKVGGLKFALVEEYPTWDRLQTLFLPLSHLRKEEETICVK